MAGGGGGGGGLSLEYTPTWVVALVCTVIVAISLVVERLLHYAGKYLLKKNQGSLFQALLKIKEELMLLGFISLLLTVFQSRITKTCIPKHLTNHWLPCKKPTEAGAKATAHFEDFSLFITRGRHLLAAASDNAGYCGAKGKAPLLSLKAVHDLHMFIFVLAVAHVVFSAFTILFGGLKIRQWRYWEDSIQKREYDPEQASKTKVTHVQEHAFIRSRFSGIGRITLFSWLKSFFKQFYGSVNKSDYTTLRLGFVMTHCRGNPKFNFYKYMTRALEHDFKKVVGISWYLWVFVFVFLLLNVYSWHAYFWISFFPLIASSAIITLLLAVGTKLEHIITQLAEEVAQKHSAVAGDLIVRPSDDHFWFQKPRLVLVLIHIILFQNSFEIAVFFWMLVLFGFDSCIMGQVGYIVPRLVVGFFAVTVPYHYTQLSRGLSLMIKDFLSLLLAVLMKMGSSFNLAIFEDHIKAGLIGWAQKAKKTKGLRKVSAARGGRVGGSNQVVRQDSPVAVRSVEMVGKEDAESAMYQGKAQEIQPAMTLP